MPLIIGKTETLSPDYDFTSTRQLFADFPELKVFNFILDDKLES